MASKVFVGLPQQGAFQGKKREEVVHLGYTGSAASNPEVRVKHLEQNIRYLQEQHQIMLSGLHHELETLRRRNRDLQFQMVFSKGDVALLQSTPNSSPDDELPHKMAVTPGHVNITPLQVELLERDLAELKTNLGEARTRNIYLQSIVDEQKRVIQAMEDERGQMSAVGTRITAESKKVNPSQDASDTVEALRDKCEDADRMVQRLKRENEEQRKEIISLRAAVSKSMSDGRRNDGQRSHPRNSQNQHSQTSRFPPLFPNRHWNPHKNKLSEYYKPPSKSAQTSQTPTTLPLLKERNTAPVSSGSGYCSVPHNNRRGYPHHRGNRSYRNYKDQQEQD